MGSGVHNAIPRTWTDGQASPTVSGKYFLGNAASQVTTGSNLILTSTATDARERNYTEQDTATVWSRGDTYSL